MQVVPEEVNRTLWSRVSLRAALSSVSSASAFRERFVGNATPGALGAVRIIVCSTALIVTLWEQLPSAALIPTSLRGRMGLRSEEHTSELQSQSNLVCRLLLEKKNKKS